MVLAVNCLGAKIQRPDITNEKPPFGGALCLALLSYFFIVVFFNPLFNKLNGVIWSIKLSNRMALKLVAALNNYKVSVF